MAVRKKRIVNLIILCLTSGFVNLYAQKPIIAWPSDLTYYGINSDIKSVSANPGCGTDNEKAAQFLKMCSYLQSMGYTHLVYQLDVFTPEFIKNAGGSWDYTPSHGTNANKYKNGTTAERFSWAKEAIESRGLTMIPVVNPLSHLGYNILNLDPSIAEVGPYTGNISYIRTKSADKSLDNATANFSFKVNSDCYVVIAHDRRITDKPSWLTNDYEKSSLCIYNNSYNPFDLYISKNLVATNGTVQLNGNLEAGKTIPAAYDMYGVFLLESDKNGEVLISNPTGTSTYTRVAYSVGAGGIQAYDTPSGTKFDKGYFEENGLEYTLGWCVFNKVKGINMCYKIPKYKDNPSLWPLYGEYLKIVNANWGTGSPQYIHLAGDELGYDNFCLVGVEKSVPLGLTPAKLVAEGIKNAVETIDNVFGPNVVTPIVFADSYFPASNGERYGLCGDFTTGAGGVLAELKNLVNGIENRLILAPWDYSNVDGVDHYPGTTVYVNKKTQIDYLVKQGFGFIPFAGEDGYNLVNEEPNVKQNMFEFMTHCNRYPSNVRGYGCATWVLHCDGNVLNPQYRSPFYNTDKIETNYSASLLAFLIKYPYAAYTLSKDDQVPYCSGVFSGVQHLRSRENFSWNYNMDYTIGLGIRGFSYGIVSSSNKVEGKWETPYNSYRLFGESGNDWEPIQSWNGTYAFTQLRDFDFSICLESFVEATDAGILIRQNFSNSVSSSPFIYFFNDKNINKTTIGYWDGSQLHFNYLPEEKFLRVTKQGNITRLYSSTDGSEYILRGEYNFLSGEVFVGMGMSPKSKNVKGNVLFTNVHINSTTPEFPCDMILSKIGTAENLGFTTNSNTNQITLSGKSTIGFTSDNVVFASKNMSGGFQVDVRLAAATYRSGIMVRQGLNADAPVVYLCSAAGLAGVHYRVTTGSNATWQPASMPPFSLPGYLRLIRYGNTIRALISSNGQTYIEIAKLQFPNGPVFVGLCADGGLNESATFTGYSIRGYDPITPIVNLLLDD
jgi:hypothetical protein